MKKQHILLLAALFITCAAQAQIHYYHAPAPWTGDNAYLFTVGSYLQPAPASLNAIDYKQGVPLTLSFRYDGEEALGTHFVMGFQAELNCNLYHTTYTLDGDQNPILADGYTTTSTAGTYSPKSAIWRATTSTTTGNCNSVPASTQACSQTGKTTSTAPSKPLASQPHPPTIKAKRPSTGGWDSVACSASTTISTTTSLPPPLPKYASPSSKTSRHKTTSPTTACW